MNILALLCLFAVPLVSSQEASKCNYIRLVECFIKILDEWAWTLYELKDNVVTITADQCRHLRELDQCVTDKFPTEQEQHMCEHSEIIAASNTVSDLLTHRKNSGSFLKSYYLLTYACSPEGQEILTKHRECLKTERIGEMTLSAGTYLTENFADHLAQYDEQEVCDKVNEKLQEYIGAMDGICAEHEASRLMCNSLTNMFKGLHPDRIGQCDLNCKIPPAETEPVSNKLPEDDESGEGPQTSHDALGGPEQPTASASAVFSLSSLVLCYLLR